MRSFVMAIAALVASASMATPALAQTGVVTLDCSPADRTWEISGDGVNELNTRDLTPSPNPMRLEIDLGRGSITLGRSTLPIVADNDLIVSAYYQGGEAAEDPDLVSILEINRQTGVWMTRRITGARQGASTMVARYSVGTCRTTDGSTRF